MKKPPLKRRLLYNYYCITLFLLSLWFAAVSRTMFIMLFGIFDKQFFSSSPYKILSNISFDAFASLATEPFNARLTLMLSCTSLSGDSARRTPGLFKIVPKKFMAADAVFELLT